MTDETTEHLLDRARAGDREAFDALCREHSDHLTTLVRRRLGAELGAKLEPEDILQETFLRAFETIGVFRGQDERSFLSWLASIAEHLIWNASQKRSLKQAQLVFDASGSGPSPSRAPFLFVEAHLRRGFEPREVEGVDLLSWEEKNTKRRNRFDRS